MPVRLVPPTWPFFVNACVSLFWHLRSMPYSTLGSDAFSPTQCNQYFEHTKIPSDQRGAALFQREVVAGRPTLCSEISVPHLLSLHHPGKNGHRCFGRPIEH